MTVNPLYPLRQLERAIAGAGSPEKAARWQAVIAGLAGGTLTVGSRTPVAGTPAWVTLEVVHGGFATGRHLAETPLRDDERALVPPGFPLGEGERERLNLWFLSDDGLAKLREALRAGTFRVEVPEDAALPVVAWLLGNGHDEAALDLVAELRPWLGRLRLAPVLGVPPRPSSALVHVATAGEVACGLREKKTPPRIAVMRETLGTWLPLLDRLVQLWCDTVEGDLPGLAREGGTSTVTGGWPCRRWPSDWTERRTAWLADYDAAASDPAAQRPQPQAKSTLARLRALLLRCEDGSGQLTGRDVGWIRRLLADHNARHGAPGSAARTSLRAEQARVAGLPLHADVAHAVAGRLSQYPSDGGIPSADAVLEPADREVPSLVRKVERALEAPAEELVARGIIGSAEVLARVLPQITAQVVAADLGDTALSGLLAQAYAAFRRRRSLLLLNLESQVRFRELPWIAASQRACPAPDGGAAAGAAARQALEEVTLLAVSGFPQTIVPNPLVSEMTALVRQAGLDLPLVEEVAADIFMGTFTRKWRRAAAVASTAMAGTLYARYYGLPSPGTWAGGDPEEGRVASDFAALCASRAAEARPGGNRGTDHRYGIGQVAVNGTIIEQGQILTTHNLAALVNGLALRDRVAPLAPGLADRAFDTALSLLYADRGNRHAQLQAVKNAAFAWRQGIYFLSLCDRPSQEHAVQRLLDTGPGRQARQVIDGLAYAVAGGTFGPDGVAPGRPVRRRLLGWSSGWYGPAGPRRSRFPAP